MKDQMNSLSDEQFVVTSWSHLWAFLETRFSFHKHILLKYNSNTETKCNLDFTKEFYLSDIQYSLIVPLPPLSFCMRAAPKISSQTQK